MHFDYIKIKRCFMSEIDKIFDLYNPESDVVHCPKGKAKMRKTLDDYAHAMVNLYGIITKEEFVQIFNSQNKVQTSVDEVYTILLPIIRKDKYFVFFKDYLVHYIVLDDFDWVEYLEKHQQDKPRYIPDKKELLEYIDEDYDGHEYWDDVLEFMLDTHESEQEEVICDAFDDIRSLCLLSEDISFISHICDRYKIFVKDMKDYKKLMGLIVEAMNNSRIWINKGFKPIELFKKNNNSDQKTVIMEVKKNGVNEPCPCGSGKKYKKCCMMIVDNPAGRLTHEECSLFYGTWFQLLDYVNYTQLISNIDVFKDEIDDEEFIAIREYLWENPKIISQFIASENYLTVDQKQLLKAWETNHIKGKFIIVKHEQSCAIFQQINDSKISTFYAVKGLTCTISKMMNQKYMIPVSAVLLPFKDKIIYDTYLICYDIKFTGTPDTIYHKEITQDTLITSLS